MTTTWVPVSTTGTVWTNITGTNPATSTPAVWDDGTPKWDLNGNVIEALWDATA